MKTKSPAGYSLCLNCPPGTFKETAGTNRCQNCVNDTHDIGSGPIPQFDYKKCICCASSQNSTDQYSSKSCTCDKQYYKANGTCKKCPKGGLCQNDYSCAFDHPNHNCTDGSQLKGNWTYSGEIFVLINCPSGLIKQQKNTHLLKEKQNMQNQDLKIVKD